MLLSFDWARSMRTVRAVLGSMIPMLTMAQLGLESATASDSGQTSAGALRYAQAMAQSSTDQHRANLQLKYQKTVDPEPALLRRLQVLFGSYFDEDVDLTVVLRKLVAESAVSELPNLGKVLYSPAHMLFLLLPDGETTNGIRVATLEDVGDMLKEARPANPLLAAYTKGFEEFALFTELMKDRGSRETLEVVWRMVPRSSGDKDRMRYLLLRPVQQAMEIGNEKPACRQAINGFIEEVRTGRRAAVPIVHGLTDIVKPTRFIRHEDQILLVLSERLIARYYVLAQFKVNIEDCVVTWEKPFFAK